MVVPNLADITRFQFEDLLTALASDDPTVHEPARAELDRLCYARWPRSFLLGTEVGQHLDAQAQHLSGSVAVTCLMDALRDGHSARVRVYAANALRVAREQAAIPLLVDALNATEKEVRSAAARVLGSFHDARIVEPLLVALSDVDSEVRSAAASSLGNIGEDRAVAALVQLLAGRNWRDRDAALHGLSMLLAPLYGDKPRPAAPSAPEALPLIREALRDPNRRVRKAAKAALASYDWHRRHPNADG